MSNIPYTKFEWQFRIVERTQSLTLAKALNLPPILAQILCARGYNSPEEAKKFLSPTIENLSDPYQLNGMDKAVARISRAVRNHEKILVFGDYDVDGIAGTAILVRALKKMGVESLSFDIPNRLSDGFGLSPARVKQAQVENVSLIITVDNGTAAYEASELARNYGIDLIITDHHQVGEKLPYAYALINPACETSDHPSAHACGAVIALKLAWALTGKPEDFDLAAVGIIADVMPLIGENRILVARGIQQIKEQPKPGIEALIRLAKINSKELRTEDIAYQLAPRLNAAGRLSNAQKALELLLTESLPDAIRLARELDELNQTRRILESEILEQAISMLEETWSINNKAIILENHFWHPGVIGIVAGRLQSLFGLPTILITLDNNGIGKGSARSIEGINIIETLSKCAEYLVAYGGHTAAAGITILENNIKKFRARFNEAIAELLPSGPSTPPLYIDAIISLSEIDGKLIRLIEKLAPFGYGNPPPLMLCQNVQVIPNSPKELRGNLIKFAVRDGPCFFPALSSCPAKRLSEIMQTDRIDIVFTPEINSYQNETIIQLRVRDFRTAK